MRAISVRGTLLGELYKYDYIIYTYILARNAFRRRMCGVYSFVNYTI